MSSQLAGSSQQPVHRNLHSCDNCRKEKKKCIFSSPWNPEDQDPPCDRCQRKGRLCAGPVYIPRKSKSAVNTVAADEGHTQGETEIPDTRVEQQEQRQRNPPSSPPPICRPRVLQPWVPTCAASSEEDDPDRKEVLIELGDILASREVVRLYLYLCDDISTWLPQCTKVHKVQSNLQHLKKSLEAEFLRLARRAHADEEIKEHYDADFRSIVERFENPPQRPERPMIIEPTSHHSSSFFAQIRNESFIKRRRDGIYSLSDHLCHDVCTTMYSGNSTSCFSLDLPRLLPTAAKAIAKIVGDVKIPCNDDFILHTSNNALAGTNTSNAQPFPLPHLTLLQTDDNILRRYIQKDPKLRHFFDVDLIGGTVSHLAAHLGRTGNLDLAFHDHSDKSILSGLKPDIFGLYPHMIAGCRNNLDALKFFVKHGANLGAMNQDGHTCLDLAVQTGATDVVRWLLEGGFGRSSHFNPICRAVEFKQIEVLDVFIRYYTDHDHHDYQDITDAADLAEVWPVPDSIDTGRWRAIVTALRNLESDRPSIRAMVLGSLSDLGYHDTIDTSFLNSTPAQGTPYTLPDSRLGYGTPYPDFFDPTMPQMYGPGGPSQQPGYG